MAKSPTINGADNYGCLMSHLNEVQRDVRNITDLSAAIKEAKKVLGYEIKTNYGTDSNSKEVATGRDRLRKTLQSNSGS